LEIPGSQASPAPRNDTLNASNDSSESGGITQKILEAGRKFQVNIRVDTVFVKSLNEFYEKLSDPEKPFLPAYFNQANNDIVINLLQVRGAATADYFGKGSREDAINGRSALANAIEQYNDGAMGLLIHELKHFKNKRNTSPFGKTVAQHCQLPVHDEISAPMEELLDRREIFMKTGDLKEAMRGVAEGSFRTGNNGVSCFYDYFKFLKKNKASLGAIPSRQEMDIIIKVAIENFMRAENIYQVNIPKITRWALTRAFQQYIKKEAPSGGPVRNFDNDLREVYYSFDGFCALDIASPSAVAKILSTVREFNNSKNVKKQNDEYIAVFSAQFDKLSEEVRAANEIQDSGQYDIYFAPKNNAAAVIANQMQAEK
jgi:hypothetical protein